MKEAGEERESGTAERMSGTLPACRSNMKNDVCSCSDSERGWIRLCIGDTTSHSPTDVYLRTSYVHTTHIVVVNHLLEKEDYAIELSLKIKRHG